MGLSVEELNTSGLESETYENDGALRSYKSSKASSMIEKHPSLRNQSTQKEETVNKIAKDLIELLRSTSSRGMNKEEAASEIGNYINELSSVEQEILRSVVPIQLKDTEEVTINGLTGILANKSEIENWRGDKPIGAYPLNEDTNPEVITKQSSQPLEYIQELAVRYLKPPTPPPPGEIVIVQESSGMSVPAPAMIIRQQPPRPDTPEPLVIREAPPQPPQQVGKKVITISGKNLPPPPRKVVIERLAPLPSKPQSVIVERWLPYSEVKRKVIFKRSPDQDPIVLKPKNIIVQWLPPEVKIRKEFKYLGVVRANPAEYVKRYGDVIKPSNELPDFVLEIKTPDGLVLAADYKPNDLHELEGDIEALSLIDLEKEGLAQYRSYLERNGIITRNNLSSTPLLDSIAASASLPPISNSISTVAPSETASVSSEAIYESIPVSGSLPNETVSSVSASVQVDEEPIGSGSVQLSNPSESNFASSSAPTDEQSVTLSSSAVVSESIAPSSDSISASASVLDAANAVSAYVPSTTSGTVSISDSGTLSVSASASASVEHSASEFYDSLTKLAERIFRLVDSKNTGRITVEDAQRIFLRLNSRLGRSYGEDDVRIFFEAIDLNQDGVLDLQEFKTVFINSSLAG